jgi:hypothetical protein
MLLFRENRDRGMRIGKIIIEHSVHIWHCDINMVTINFIIELRK